MLKEISNKNFRILTEFQGYFVFPIVIFCLIMMLVLNFSFLLLFVTMLAIIRLIKTNQINLIIISFYFALLALTISIPSLYYSTKIQKELIEERINNTLIIKVDSINIDGDSLKCSAKNEATNEKVIVYYSLISEDEKRFWETVDTSITINGTITYSLPEGKRNLNGFDYKNYLKEKKNYRVATVEELDHVFETRIPIYSVITQLQIIRRKIQLHIGNIFPETTQIYMKSLLIGIKESDSFELKQTTSKLGITHLFSLSGIHVFFIFSIFQYFFRRIGISIEFIYWLTLLALGSFFVISGMTTSIGRCILMIGFRETNKRFYLKLSPLDIWSLTLFVCMIFQPYLLLGLAGQLTFLLTFVIIYIRSLIGSMELFYIQPILFSICLGVISAPILIYHFYEWLYIGELFTLILLPIISYIILPVILLLFLLSLITSSIGSIPIVKSFDTLLLALNSVIESMAELAHYRVAIGKISSWQLLMLIAIVFWIVSSFGKLKQHKKGVLICLASIFLILNQKYLNPFGMVAFIDVGQGDSIFIQLPFHQGNYLIDTGGRLTFEKDSWKTNNARGTNASKTVIPFLKSMGVSHLDTVFITHPDEDHAGDILEVASEFTIRNLVISSGSENNDVFFNRLQQLNEEGTNIEKRLGPSGLIKTDGFLCDLLYPLEIGTGSNNDSLVMLVKVKDKQVLLTGDLEELGEEKLCQYYPSLSIDILKVGHHGSKSSTSDKFILQLQPTEAIISVGKNNRYQHPHAEVIERLQNNQVSIFTTAEQGMIYFKWSNFAPSTSPLMNVK